MGNIPRNTRNQKNKVFTFVEWKYNWNLISKNGCCHTLSLSHAVYVSYLVATVYCFSTLFCEFYSFEGHKGLVTTTAC